jgi:hypothetical protein
VDAAARSIAGSNLTILNGAQGVNDALAGLVGQGLSILEVFRKSPGGQTDRADAREHLRSSKAAVKDVAPVGHPGPSSIRCYVGLDQQLSM